MTKLEDLTKLPYIDVTFRMYETSEPYKEEGDSKSYFATFRYEGATLETDEGKVLASTNPGAGGGVYVKIGEREFYIPPDDLVYITAKHLEVELPDFDAHRPKEEPEEEPQEEHEPGCNCDQCMYLRQDNQAIGIYDPDDLFPVDYERHGLLFTGNSIYDIPEPHIRKWPGCKDKRQLRIQIARYYGPGVHYYVSIHQESNPIWDGRPSDYDNSRPVGWTEAWDDEEGKGKDDSDLMTRTRFEYLMDAKEAIEKILPDFADHEIVYEDFLSDSDRMIYFGKHGE